LKHQNNVLNNSYSNQPKSGRYKAMWHDSLKLYSIKPLVETKLNDDFENHFELFISNFPEWHEYEDIFFENKENHEDYGDKYLSFVEGSLKVHKIKKIIYEDDCFDVELESN
jgi:hypothetical protein